jgi:site-specific recombinase XerD
MDRQVLVKGFLKIIVPLATGSPSPIYASFRVQTATAAARHAVPVVYGERGNMESRYVFVTERGGPATTAGFLKTIARTGEAAKLSFPIHPHMLRHSTGYKLANDGHDTRALQHYMGHKNIMHTVRYTEIAPNRFKNFWND